MNASPMIRARAGRDHRGRDAWIGEFRLQKNGMWFAARSGSGAILYESEAAALAGAAACRKDEVKALTQG